MDEAAAITIANETAHAELSGQFERLEITGVHKIDRDSNVRCWEKLWEEGAIHMPREGFEDMVKLIARLPCRTQWCISHRAYDFRFKGAFALASTTIDDENGSVEWKIILSVDGSVDLRPASRAD